MQENLPFFEGPEDALRAAVAALGGAKKVGAMLWPDKTIDAAGRQLLDALNPGRAEKLDVTQVMFIFKRARDVGHHAAFLWFAGDVGYEAKPVTPAEEENRLVDVIEASSKTLTAALAAMERLQRVRSVSAA
jgi:hypothetical protein